jgi:dihydrolipoamide dehydrogenase
MEFDGKKIITSREAMTLPQQPKRMAIIGAGAIGCEFADVYAAFGTQVTIIEVADRILPLEDRDCSAVVEKSYRKRGMNVLTGTRLEKAEIGKDGVKLTVKTPKGETQVVEAERVLSAIGRAPLVEDIGLKEVGVKLDERGFIAIDRQMKTNVEGIYAIGDVAGPPMLAHKAEHEGVVCIEAIKGLDPHPIDKLKIPGCTYCQPQIASVGLTEQKAKEQGREIKVGRFPFVGNGKAIALGEDQGLVKTIFDAKTGQLLGAHLVGAEVTELIQGFVIAMQLETTEEDLMHTVFPHPTLSETMHESVLDAFGRVIHV